MTPGTVTETGLAPLAESGSISSHSADYYV